MCEGKGEHWGRSECEMRESEREREGKYESKKQIINARERQTSTKTSRRRDMHVIRGLLCFDTG